MPQLIGMDSEGRLLEQYVVMLCDEVPLPLPGRTCVGFKIGSSCAPVPLSRPPADLDFPQLELSLEGLFQLLSVDIVLEIMCCVLTESQILFHSSNYSLLTYVQECVLALCFPFQWEHVYIPLLPKSLLSVLQAPVPFLVGVHSSVLSAEAAGELGQTTRVVVVDFSSGPSILD